MGAATQALSSPAAPALQALGTRDPSDPVMAFIDAWAVAADVLTFYRERLTNEGYLRCARDERSLRWLAGEVGYKPRPGVAASAWLAYMMDAHAAPVQIGVGAKAQTSPHGDEQMQTFETLEALNARAEWSAMSPRQTRMPKITLADALSRDSVKLAGTSTSARPGERLMFVFGYEHAQQVVREIAEAKLDVQRGWVDVSLVPKLSVVQATELHEVSKKLTDLADPDLPPSNDKTFSALQLFFLTSFFLGGTASDALALSTGLKDRIEKNRIERPADRTEQLVDLCVKVLQAIAKPIPGKPVPGAMEDIDAVLAQVGTPASTPPRSAGHLKLSTLAGLASTGSKRGALLKQVSPRLDDRLYQAWRSVPAQTVEPESAPQAFILRAVTSPYGAAAPKREFKEPFHDWDIAAPDTHIGAAHLDNVFSNIAPGSLALVDVPISALPKSELGDVARLTRLARITSTQIVGRSDYLTNARVTRLDMVDAKTGEPLQVVEVQKLPRIATTIENLRKTVYTVQSEAVTLAEEPINNSDVSGAIIDMDSLLDGIDVGRWIIVHGERTDIAIKRPASPDVILPGIVDGELALVAGVDQQPYPESSGDALHTVLRLATPLAYTYRRSTVKVYGNVVKASHGETGSEAIGSGSATARLQRFALRRAPLTFVPAVTTSGVQGTQQLRVNNVQWLEVDSLLDAEATERVYEMAINEAGMASYTFGDDIHGARLPTGQGNVRVAYRAGIGAAGNARAGQISQAVTRPLGVNSVTNPLAASGGADRDGSERIRANVPLAALSLSPLSRLVSVADYAIFARRYAGVGQAVARKLADGAFECVHVTLAGVDDAPLRSDDDLVTSLRAAYEAFGDPALPVVVDIRELVALFIEARFAAVPGHDWDTVKLAIQGRLHELFSFDRRQLGQSIYLSEVVGAIQSVTGVDWVDVDLLGGLSEVDLRNKDALAGAVMSMQTQISPGPVQSVVRVRAAMPVADAPADLSKRAGTTRFLPAQLAFLPRGVPGTLVLNRA
ncbi:hypothetical protein ASC87_14060 [Rhizobacter sp. Root1221]|nr:hypothetical protein ASC87_14060 [Rhizobacter sp. Root1221]